MKTMKTLILWLTVACGLLLTSGGLRGAPPGANDKAAAEAQSAALEWLKLVDAGKHAEAWSTAASDFKKTVSQKKWESAVREMRAPLGKPAARKLKSAEQIQDLPGAPEGDYVIVRFDSAFEKRASATETVTVFRGSDLKWRMSAYTIK